MSQVRPNFDDMDPCCQKEVIQNRKYDKVMSILREHDRIAMAERRRLNLVSMSNEGEEVCRCSYDPKSDGGEYAALTEERANLLKRNSTQKKDIHPTYHEDHDDFGNDDSNESDSDSEFDYLLDDFENEKDHQTSDINGSNEVYELEQQRRLELELAILSHERNKQHGYGVHRQMHPSRVLRAAGLGLYESTSSSKKSHVSPPMAAVLHLYNPNSRASAQMDLFLEELATRYIGTKFLRADGRSTLLHPSNNICHLSCFYSQRLIQENDLPCLFAIKEGYVQVFAPKFSALVDDKLLEMDLLHANNSHSSTSNFDSKIYESEEDQQIKIVDDYAVEQWLERSGLLLHDPPKYEDLCNIRPEEEALLFALDSDKNIPGPTSSSLKKKGEITNIELEENYYDCGLEGCCKTYSHKHVGHFSTEQDGLVVSREEVLDNGIQSS